MKVPPRQEVYWYTKRKSQIKKIEKAAAKAGQAADVCIVGGGMAGLSAAKRLSEAGRKVVVLEASFCGGGASGKSSGFITPDSELGFSDLLSDYGPEEAVKLYQFAEGGVELIRSNIKEFNIDCDYQIQDSLFAANSQKSFKKIEEDQEARAKFGYRSQLYQKEKLPEIIGSQKYFGGLRYPDSFGINSYLYCQALKDILEKRGVEIYEGSRVTEIKTGQIKVGDLTFYAENIIAATDHFLADLNIRKKDIYHVQTFLTVSEPLSSEQMKKIFPEGQLMVWDTDLIYQYFRLIEGNRLLFGAANLLYTYNRRERKNYSDVVRKIYRYIEKKFGINDLALEYSWPGLLGITKDFMPIAGEDSKMKKVYYIGGSSGLPWAAALGDYMAEKIISGRYDYDKYFLADRHYPISNKAQAIISKPLAFAISHGIVELT